MRRRLSADALRLDTLLAAHRVTVDGGTSLFRHVTAADAASLFDALGNSGILVRNFSDRPNELRLGLPGSEEEWRRLDVATRHLAGGSRQQGRRRARRFCAMIWVCPLSQVDVTVASTQADRLVSLLAPGTAMVRPSVIAEQNHLWLSLHDIAEPQEGMTLPGEAHMRTLLDFAKSWDRARPLVINCYAGISRSTASAYIIAAALQPSRNEGELAQALRLASPSATPNPRLIALADAMLNRRGRMVEAVQSIGRGADAFEGVPFALDIDR